MAAELLGLGCAVRVAARLDGCIPVKASKPNTTAVHVDRKLCTTTPLFVNAQTLPDGYAFRIRSQTNALMIFPFFSGNFGQLGEEVFRSLCVLE